MTSEQLRLYVGIDVGGTNIAAGLVRAEGEIVARARNRTPRDCSAEETLAAIIGTVDQLFGEGDVDAGALAAIGLGVAGLVNPEEGILTFTPNTNLAGLNLVEPLKERFAVPVALENDVNVGILGESWLGAARGAREAVGVFIGTGIGGGIISNGRLLRGAAHAAGEIGHLIMQIDGPQCGCGNYGCFEALASRTAIARDIREAVEAGTETWLTRKKKRDLGLIKSNALRRALKREDQLVTDVMRRAAQVIGYACMSLLHLLDPEVIVLGGGVMEACGDFVMPIVQEVVARDPMYEARERGKIVISELGDDAGILGAVALVRGLTDN